MMKRLTLAAAALAAALPLAAAPAASADPAPATRAGAVDQVVTFGDSWSSADYVYGTSPGGSWSQILARRLGTVQKADTDGGLNYARGGAFVAPIEPYSTASSPTPVSRQIAMHRDQHGRFTPRQLVTIWAGGNDEFAYLGGFDEGDRATFCTGTQSQAQLNDTAAEMSLVARREARMVGRVLRHGAERVVVLDMVDLSLTANDGCMTRPASDVAGVMSKLHNLALVDELRSAGLLDDPRVRLVRISKLFDAIAASPRAYGFRVVDGDACVSGAPDCGRSNWVAPHADRTHVFGQSGHFTAHTRELVARRVHRAVRARWPSAS